MKVRLDILLMNRGLFDSRERARATVMSGGVYVNGQKEDKPGTAFPPDAAIEVREKDCPFVSRGGLKLQKALDVFGIDVTGLCALDGGASTGGFTDCLLQRGAAKVWAVDVGYGQLAWRLRNDPRVTCIERTNLRHLTREQIDGDLTDMATLDLSFISLKLILPAIRAVLNEKGFIVCLVKPQFEAGREKVGKGGVVKCGETHIEVLRNHIIAAEGIGLGVKGLSFSPVKGPKGNVEFLSFLVNGESSSIMESDLKDVADAAYRELC